MLVIVIPIDKNYSLKQVAEITAATPPMLIKQFDCLGAID
tara:strand:- start:32 stop:151 length:120 start_codon:yes stop_codon:yes gene_type:complete